MGDQIIRTEVSAEQLASFTREDEFMSVFVDLMVEAASWVVIAANATDASGKWSRDQAAVGGNIVRLSKLLHAVLDQTCQRRGEIAFIMSRLTFETIVNIRFLIREFNPDLIRSYIRYSLRHERRLHERIMANISDRGDVRLPIEERMLKSIDRSFAASGITLAEIDLQDRKPWGGKNIREKCEVLDLDMAYLAMFGGGSHGVHGNWQELYGNHLEWDGADGFTPAVDWKYPRPQILSALSLYSIDAVEDFLNFLDGADDASKQLPELADLRARILLTDRAHEKYLQTKQWPRI